MNEILLKYFEHEEVDECMHECSKWLAGYVSEYSDNLILDIVIYKNNESKWTVSVYYRERF